MARRDELARTASYWPIAATGKTLPRASDPLPQKSRIESCRPSDTLGTGDPALLTLLPRHRRSAPIVTILGQPWDDGGVEEMRIDGWI